jgi:energy-coupling factor transporter ATP-binding protein EcfA2
MRNGKGALWRRWDLHVHTPESHLNNGFGDDFEAYFKTLMTAAVRHEIAAIGVTDYFTIEGYKKIRAYMGDEGELARIFGDAQMVAKVKTILLLPNIELRLDVLVDDRRVNFHVIFSDEIAADDIEQNFLWELDISHEAYPQDRDQTRKLRIHNIEALGAQLKSQHSNFHGTGIQIGMMNATVSDSQVSEVLAKRVSLFEGKYLLAVAADEDLSSVGWDGQGHNTRKRLIQKSDFLFSGNPNTSEWGLGKKHATVAGYVKEFKGLKPCLHGSDAHAFGCLFEPAMKRYCWVKAEPTFEGLKQIKYEPEIRVRIQPDNPSEGEAYAKISKVCVGLPEDIEIGGEAGNADTFCFAGHHEVAFSNNLTCLIGGRGTGKSTLAHVIYNASGQDAKRLTEVESLLTRVRIPPSPLPKIAEATKCEVPSNAEFIFQNEIEKYAGNIDAMSELVTHRLINLSAIEGDSLNELTEKWGESRDGIAELVEAWDRCEEKVRDIDKNNKEIDTRKKQAETISSDEYKTLQSELKVLSNELSRIELYTQNYDKARLRAEGMKKFLSELKWSEEQGSVAVAELMKGIDTFLREAGDKYNVYVATHKKEDVEVRINTKKQELKKFLVEKGLQAENIEELATANQEIARYEAKNLQLAEEMAPYREIYDRKDETIANYEQGYSVYSNRYEEVCRAFATKLGELKVGDKTIEFEVMPTEKNIRSGIVEFIKEELSEESGLKADAIERRVFDDIEVKDYIGDIRKLKQSVLKIDDTAKNTLFLKNLFSDNGFVEKLRLRLVRDYYNIGNIRVKTKYGGNALENTSFGERCGIVLAVVLAAGTNPIVIDQPEDHLDGKFISTVLVRLIRKQKNNRQIILITRDANIVIGGDAELINIFEIEGQGTKITPATIEDLEQREKYIWVLDGGTEAFRKREEKYDLRVSY